MSSRPPTLLLLLVLLLAVGGIAADNAARRKRWRPEEFPNPQVDYRKCGRGVRSSICDPELILTTEQQNMVDGLINEIASGAAPFKTSDCDGSGQKGFQVGLAPVLEPQQAACMACTYACSATAGGQPACHCSSGARTGLPGMHARTAVEKLLQQSYSNRKQQRLS